MSDTSNLPTYTALSIGDVTEAQADACEARNHAVTDDSNESVLTPKPAPSPDDSIQLLRTVIAHRDYVRIALQRIIHELEERSLAHDLSKLSADEFAGFVRINLAAREHPYGSEEYRAELKAEKSTVDLHYSRNNHHPEHCSDDPTEQMGFIEIIEMVCDWRSAYLTYGSQGTWHENMLRQADRYKHTFSPEQWWLIWDVSNWLVWAESLKES